MLVCLLACISSDGQSRANAQRQRIDINTRQLEGAFSFTPPASQQSGDMIAALLTAWHMVVKPIAMERCIRRAWQTGEHLHSITNMPRFIQNNTSFVADLFKNSDFFQPNLPENEWFFLHNVRRMIMVLFEEACKQRQGRWQWEGFYLESWEKTMYTHIVLRAYADGSEPWTG